MLMSEVHGERKLLRKMSREIYLIRVDHAVYVFSKNAANDTLEIL